MTMRLLAKVSILLERCNGRQEEGALSDELQRTGSIQPHTAASKVCHNSGTEMKTKSTKLDQLAFISICLQFPQCRIPKQSHDEEKTARLTLPLEAAERTNVGKTTQRKNKNTHWYEQKCQSHTSSGTINSSTIQHDNSRKFILRSRMHLEHSTMCM